MEGGGKGVKVVVEEQFTVHQVAERLHCTDKTVYKYIREGTLKAKTGVRPYLISASSLQSFLDSVDDQEDESA
jgi:excisionase family DNA binding protein